jgi:hypothetical protein
MPVPLSPAVGATPPRAQRGGRQREVMLAAHAASEVCETTRMASGEWVKTLLALFAIPYSLFASLKRGRRSAERRIQPWPCHKRGTAARRADEAGAIDGRRSPALPGRARLPALHRGTSPMARLISGPRFLELPGPNGRTLPGASAASTSRAGHSAGRYDARSRPGAECVVPPAGTAPAPPCGAPSRRRPSKIRRAGWGCVS